MKKEMRYSLESCLDFGKYKGESIRSILDQHYGYILWCLENIQNFILEDDAWDYAIYKNAKFSQYRPQSSSTIWRTNLEGLEELPMYPWKGKKLFSKYLHNVATDAIVE